MCYNVWMKDFDASESDIDEDLVAIGKNGRDVW